MHDPVDSPLAASERHLDRAAVIDARQRTWSWRQVHAEAIALSARMAGASAVCNLCTSRLAFLITCLAALRSRCLMILPPSGSPADLHAVLKARPNAVVVGDAASWPEAGADPCPEGTRYLACRPQRGAPGAGRKALAWAPAWDAIAVLLYTSGSTGAPEPQPKSLRQLARGARVLGERLASDVEGGLAAIGRIVCSVPPQHMFGLECSVMLPLVHGMPVLDRRPLLPVDVADAFAAGPPGAWIATPMHLRNLAESRVAVASCSVVVVSTMPLAQPVARSAEQQTAAPVLEIYGSTETGVLAMRRTACENRWRPVEGVALERSPEAIVAAGSHFASPARLLDELLLAPDGTFTLLGRQSDLVKIAGRRASLAGLNLMLQELPGLEDGVFYLPATGSPTERLCLIYAGPPLDRMAARRWLRARLDPVFLPRAFIRLERLPRSDNGKLTRLSLDTAFNEWQAAAQPVSPRGPRRHRTAARAASS